MSSRKTPVAVPLQIRTAKPSSVRAVNRSIMLELIRRRQPISRAELARLTGVFRSSVSDIIDELIEENLLTEEKATASQRGRVPFSLRLNDTGYRVLGLNIRPAYSQIAYAGLSGRIQGSLTFETPTSPKKLVDAVASAVAKLQQGSAANGSNRFRRVGIAIPGHVDAPLGRILWIPTHKELTDFPIGDEIQAQTGIQTLVDNDCNVGALSELWLSTEERKNQNTNFVFLNVSDFGTGAGAVVNGEIYRGNNGHFAAEFGHMVIEPSGPLCTCGRHGCWEQYVSNHATWHRIHARVPFTVENFEEMLAAAAQGEPRAVLTFRETAKYLSIGIANIGFAFNPSEVVVAGRITAIWDLIREEIESCYGSSHFRFPVRAARLSADDSLLHGAVCLALRETFAGPKFG